MRENFPPANARPDDVERAFAAGGLLAAVLVLAGFVQDRHVQFAVGINRAGVALLDAELQSPKNFSAVRVDGGQVADLAGEINGIAGEDGRAGRSSQFVAPHFHLRPRHDDRASRRVGRHRMRNPHRYHLARFIRRAVNCDDFVVVVDEDG